MQSTGPNANRASIICILESSLLEYGTSIHPCWADNSIISRSNSNIYRSYDALLLMQSAIWTIEQNYIEFLHPNKQYVQFRWLRTSIDGEVQKRIGICSKLLVSFAEVLEWVCQCTLTKIRDKIESSMLKCFYASSWRLQMAD